MLSDWSGTAYGLSELGTSVTPRGVIAGTHKEMEDVTRCLPNGDGSESAGQSVASEPLQPAITPDGIASPVPASDYDDSEIVDPFGTGDPDEMAHCQHGYGGLK